MVLFDDKQYPIRIFLHQEHIFEGAAGRYIYYDVIHLELKLGQHRRHLLAQNLGRIFNRLIPSQKEYMRLLVKTEQIINRTCSL